jgi:hypothetical protein
MKQENEKTKSGIIKAARYRLKTEARALRDESTAMHSEQEQKAVMKLMMDQAVHIVLLSALLAATRRSSYRVALSGSRSYGISSDSSIEGVLPAWRGVICAVMAWALRWRLVLSGEASEASSG